MKFYLSRKVLKEAEKLIEHIQETYTKLRLDEVKSNNTIYL